MVLRGRAPSLRRAVCRQRSRLLGERPAVDVHDEPEALRCLKRRVSRPVFRLLQAGQMEWAHAA